MPPSPRTLTGAHRAHRSSGTAERDQPAHGVRQRSLRQRRRATRPGRRARRIASAQRRFCSRQLGLSGHEHCACHARWGSALLYTAEQVTGLAIPADEPDYGGFHEALSYVHVGGMVLTPALGLLSANPRVFAIDDTTESGWPTIGRTIHIGVALITAGAYWTTTLIELTADAPQTERAAAPTSEPSWGVALRK